MFFMCFLFLSFFFPSVFHVTDQNGKKILQEDVADRIQQVIDLCNVNLTLVFDLIFVMIVI